jgi:hypothetical protein
MAMVCFSVIFEHEPPCARPLGESPNALRIRVARVRINHLGPQKAATQFCVELSREWDHLEFEQRVERGKSCSSTGALIEIGRLSGTNAIPSTLLRCSMRN